MKLIHILLHTCLSFLAVASELPPDIMARSAGITTYTVTAVDLANTYEAEALLKSKYGDSNVATNRYNGIFLSWTVKSPDKDLSRDIEALAGIRNVKRERSSANMGRSLGEQDVAAKSVLPAVDSVSEDAEASSESALVKLVRRDAPWYSCLANSSEYDKTEEFLKSKVQKGTGVYRLQYGDDVQGWDFLYLDDDAKKAVESYEGIRYLTLGSGKRMADFRALSRADELQPQLETRRLSQVYRERIRRTEDWVKQENADKALVMDSQYNGANLDNLKDFVHKADGEGVFIYVIDRGVRTSTRNGDNGYEFRPPPDGPLVMPVIQTLRSKDLGQKPYEDDSDEHTHGTAVAAKALGSQYGLAKKATLIPVKTTYEPADYRHGLALVIRDIILFKRDKHSVVVLAEGWSEDGRDTYEKLKNDPDLQQMYGTGLRVLMKRGVPVVCAAGNYAETQGRENIDTLPALFQDNDAPLINVGAADYAGRRASFSQGGSQLTIYAPGVDVEFPDEHDNPTTKKGTSLAAPQVAGLIATYLSYAQKPWDDSLTGLERVRAIRNYLVSDASSWERQPGIRMIWNGATQQNHQDAGANAAKPPSNTAPKDPTPPTPASPPKPQKSMALGIVFNTRTTKNPGSGASTRDNRWLFFTGAVGVPSVCYKQIDAKYMVELKKENGELVRDPGWPVGTYPLKIDNMDCNYMNDGKGNPGALWCGGREGPIECFEEHKRTAEEGVVECEKLVPGDTVLRRGVVYCEW